MSFFRKRKADQPQTVAVNSTKAVPDIISKVGEIPVPQTSNGLLNRTQQVYVWSFARTFTERTVENKRIQASAAAYRLEESGTDATRTRRVADYWASVAAHAAQLLA